MLRKRMEELRGEEVDRLIEERCEAIHARLSGAAVDALLNQLQPREVTNHDGEMFLNGVYLVPTTRRARTFTAAGEPAR